MLYIGVDLGTSAVKLLLMDEEGRIQNIVSREYPISFPHPGWSEQNPEDWFAETMTGLKELLQDADKSQVAGLSFGGQMHGLVILDEADAVIRPAILWNDGRTFEECDYLNNVIGKEKLSKYFFYGLYRTKDFVGKKQRAGKLCSDCQDYAAEGLYRIYADRRALYGCVGCIRYAFV